MRDYELLLLIRPNLDRDAAIAAAKSVADLIQKHGGEVKSSNVWGRRRLAYPINNQYEATYILLKLNTPPASLKNVEFDLKLHESVLRFLIIKDELVESVELQGAAEATTAQPAAAEDTPAQASAEAEPAAAGVDEVEVVAEEVEASSAEASSAEAPAAEVSTVEAEDPTAVASEAAETPSQG